MIQDQAPSPSQPRAQRPRGRSVVLPSAALVVALATTGLAALPATSAEAPLQPPAPSAPAQAASVRTSPLDLSGRATWIGQASDSSLTYVGLPLPEGDSPETKRLQKKVKALDTKIRKASDRYNAAQAQQLAAEEKLTKIQAELVEARQRRDDAQAVVNLYVRAAYQGDPAAAGTAELNLLLNNEGADALHAAALLRYGGTANARVLEALRDAEADVARLEDEANKTVAERRAMATAVADELASIRVQLDDAEVLLGEEITASVAAGLGQIPAPVVSHAVTGGEVGPLATRVSSFVVVEGVPAADVAKLGAMGLPMTVASFGKVNIAGRTVGLVGIDPSTARSFSAAGMAERDDLWQVVARDEIFASHAVVGATGVLLGRPAELRPFNATPPVAARLGAIATLGWPGSDVVVSRARAAAFGATTTRVLLSADGSTPEAITARVRDVVGPGPTITTAGSMAPPASAFYPGSQASAIFGTFSYRPNANGTVAPDPGWVARNIVTTTVPILGRVTCHRLMITQLRGALTEVVASGLASAIHPDEYAGCYYPRYIEYRASSGLSLHTWGIALDMNVPGNLRGGPGQFDRRVVAIFKRWGFRWGGDWSYTDPMHFELGALLRQ